MDEAERLDPPVSPGGDEPDGRGVTPDTPARGHASGYSVVYSVLRGGWVWTAFHQGNRLVGSSVAKIDAEWQARDAWDRLVQDPNG